MKPIIPGNAGSTELNPILWLLNKDNRLSSYLRYRSSSACRKAVISSMDRSRYSPGCKSPNPTGPMVMRTNRRVGKPTAAVMWRIWCFLPSRSVRRIQLGGGVGGDGLALGRQFGF